MDQFAHERESFLALIRHWHAGHPRSDQVDHCIHVAQWLERALDLEPTPVERRRTMLLAALGHDLYGDSAIPPADIVTGYGPEVDALIRELTAEGGVANYVDRVASGSEEARLIKFSDGVDNYHGLVEHGLVQKDRAWALDVVSKHMEPMFSRLASIPFRAYPAAGTWLNETLQGKRERFWWVVGELPLVHD